MIGQLSDGVGDGGELGGVPVLADEPDVDADAGRAEPGGEVGHLAGSLQALRPGRWRHQADRLAHNLYRVVAVPGKAAEDQTHLHSGVAERLRHFAGALFGALIRPGHVDLRGRHL